MRTATSFERTIRCLFFVFNLPLFRHTSAITVSFMYKADQSQPAGFAGLHRAFCLQNNIRQDFSKRWAGNLIDR